MSARIVLRYLLAIYAAATISVSTAAAQVDRESRPRQYEDMERLQREHKQWFQEILEAERERVLKDQQRQNGYWSEDSGVGHPGMTDADFSDGPPPAFGSVWGRNFYRAASRAIEDTLEAITPLQISLLVFAILAATPVCSAHVRAICVRVFRAAKEAVTKQNAASEEVRVALLGMMAVTVFIALAVLDGWEVFSRGRAWNWSAVAAPLTVWVTLACACIWRTRNSIIACTRVFRVALARERESASQDTQ